MILSNHLSLNQMKKFTANIRVTLILSCVYLALFIVDISIGNNTVFNALSGSGFDKLNGQIYRVFTASFLHAGWIHLIANIMALVCVGSFIEKRLGHLNFLAVFLVSDILASIMFYGYFGECSNGNGSSIAIYALMAVLLVLWLRYPNAFPCKWYHPALIYTVIYFVVASFISGNYTTIIMHSFGFFFGLVVGLAEMKLKFGGVKNM